MIPCSSGLFTPEPSPVLIKDQRLVSRLSPRCGVKRSSFSGTADSKSSPSDCPDGKCHSCYTKKKKGSGGDVRLKRHQRILETGDIREAKFESSSRLCELKSADRFCSNVSRIQIIWTQNLSLFWQITNPCPHSQRSPFTSCLSENSANVWMYLTISYWFQRGLMDSNKVLCYPGVGQLHQQGPTVGGCSQQGPQREALPLLTDRWAHGLRSLHRQIAKKTETRSEKKMRQQNSLSRFYVTDLQTDLDLGPNSVTGKKKKSIRWCCRMAVHAK